MNIPSIKKFGTSGLFVLATIVFATTLVSAQANPDAEHCANGDIDDGPPVACTGGAYVGGNLNENNSQYVEGDSVPTRAFRTDFTAGTTGLTITLRYDITKNGKHAYDYLTTYDRSYAGDPCTGIGVCNPAVFTTFEIPDDPTTAAAGITQDPGDFTMFGGTITGVSYGAIESSGGPGNVTQTQPITITFTADSSTVVLAWGAHIASRVDWGLGNSAGNISGSPYHQDVGGHNLSLSAGSVAFPAVIEIRKSVQTWWGAVTSPESFPFTSTNTFLDTVTDDPITSFNLIDNVVDPEDPGTHNQVGRVLAFGTEVLFEEGQVLGWGPSDVTCVRFDAGFGTDASLSTWSTGLGTVQPFTPAFASVTVQEGAGVRCTFSNLQGEPTAAEVSAEGRVVGPTGRGLAGITVILTNASDGTRETAVTNTFGFFRFEGLTVLDLYTVTAVHKRYTFNELTFAPDDNVSGLTLTATSGTLR